MVGLRGRPYTNPPSATGIISSLQFIRFRNDVRTGLGPSNSLSVTLYRFVVLGLSAEHLAAVL
jgi:hypothetical protein